MYLLSARNFIFLHFFADGQVDLLRKHSYLRYFLSGIGSIGIHERSVAYYPESLVCHKPWGDYLISEHIDSLSFADINASCHHIILQERSVHYVSYERAQDVIA